MAWGLESNIKGPQGPPGINGSPDTAAQVLAKLVTVDGSGSGLDADKIDGVNITVSSTPPSSPNVGDIWIDTS